MKSGISLVEMAKEIQRQAELKADYMMDTRSLRLEPFGSDLYLNAYTPSGEMAVEPLEINAIAHRQIGTHLKIPAAYYDKMLTQHPQLLSENVNAWFEREPAVRLVRTIGGTARAFLSNRYRRIDNLDIAGIVLPVLQDMEGMHFESCQLTESRMYIKVVNTRLQAEVSPGDIVQSGIIISNSEVGLGSVNIQPLVYRLVCSNGMVVNDAQTRRNHVGRVNEATENYQLYSDKTLEADDKAFAMKIQDTVAFRLTVTVGHNDALSVRDTEQLFIVAVNKANIPVGFFDVLVQPFLYIAEAVEVIVAPRWITAKHERIFLGICSEAELSGICTLHFAFLVLTPITHHLRTALKQSVLLGAQGIDYIIQVPLELIAFPLRSGIKPSGIKLIAA